MIKRVGGFSRAVLLLAALVLVGYNTWEINGLRAEVARLRQKHPPAAAPLETRAPAFPAVPHVEWVGAVQKHAERAQAFLRIKRYADAKAEIEQAAQIAQKNGQSAQKQSRDAIQKLQRTADAVSQQAAALWAEQGKTAQSAAPKSKP